jgi:competence protein ComEC
MWEPFAPETWPGNLEMTAIDVGQGDSILVVFPDGKRLLMDGGGIPAFGHQQHSQLDIGEDVVAPYLWNREFRSLDVLVLSHAHEDHIGGLPALVSDFHPRELWTGALQASPLWDALRRRALENRVKIVPQTAPAHFAFGGAEIDVLAPLADYVPRDTPTNNDSLVLRIRFGRHTFLLCGDAERPIERRMIAENEIQRVDVLKVAHHGSRTSSTEAFLDLAQPAFAVISAGFENTYGHPNRDVLERLREHHTMTLRTDQDGLVTVRSDGQRLFVETYRQRSGVLLAPALLP